MSRILRFLIVLIVLIAVGAAYAWRRSSVVTIAFDPNSLVRFDVDGDTPSLAAYDFERPTRSFELPPELIEISALTDVNAHTVACVQDELGTVYFIDLRTGEIVDRVAFGPRGDYEGLARAGDSLWVIESAGRMRELVLRGERLEHGTVRRLAVGHDDFEGLAYDAATGSILVVPKDRPAAKEERRERRVYALDSATGELRTELALDTSIDRITAEAERDGIALPTHITKKDVVKSRIKARFSSIAVHPRSGHIFVLSAVDGAALEFDRQSRLLGIHGFDRRSLPKAEGLAFLANGDLVVASEGVDGPSRLLVFQYHEPPTR